MVIIMNLKIILIIVLFNECLINHQIKNDNLIINIIMKMMFFYKSTK